MHRFYLAPELAKGPVLQITDREAHHAATVLRLRAGEVVTVLDGIGGVLECRITSCDRKRLSLEVLNRKSASLPAKSITLIQALPKGRIIEDIIQKATELGVSRIVPVVTERTVMRIGGESAAKGEKWQQVAIEAVKQCGSPWLPKVDAPATFDEVIAQGESSAMSLVGSLQPGSRHPRHYFDVYRREHGGSPDSVSVWVGPEGDFSAAEVAAIEATGALPITLGPLVLRVETAAVFCLAVINYELDSEP